MSSADRVIRWSTALAVFGVAAVAVVASCEHANELVRAHGESGWTAHMVPLTVDGLIYVSSMVMLDSTRRKRSVPLARWLLALGIAATLGTNVVHGLEHGPVGAAVAAWPAVALADSLRRDCPLGSVSVDAIRNARSGCSVKPASVCFRGLAIGEMHRL